VKPVADPTSINTVETLDPQAKNLAACSAALALAKSGQKDRAAQILVAAAKNSDAMVRMRAAETLMEVGGERAVMSLLDLLDDPHPQVRFAATGAIGVLRVHSSVERLLKIMNTDSEMTVRIMAARTLGKLGNKAGLSLIIRLLDAGEEKFCRLAVMALHDIIGQKFTPTKDGILSAKRYLSVNLKKILAGG
jgi:HEAT repeat protein